MIIKGQSQLVCIQHTRAKKDAFYHLLSDQEKKIII